MSTALVGGQFGSEGKGLIAGHIAKDFAHHVRVGAANAGHTVYTKGLVPESCDSDVGQPWEKHVMQQIPCAAYANPEACLYVGPGALVSHDIFDTELDRLFKWRRAHGLPDPRIYVDPRAHVITEEHVEREQGSGLAERIGSTSTIAREGIGTAQAARVMREADCVTAQTMYGDEEPEDVDMPIYLANVPEMLHVVDRHYPNSVLLEGTQGTGLSLNTGFFPYVTSRNTSSAGLCADAGVAPNSLERVILVCRTFPIRVAGPSGPFWADSEEIAWEQLDVDPEKERTTVTKKIRRVATFSLEQVVDAVRINGATEIALTFADYIDPDITGMSGRMKLSHPQLFDLRGAIEDIQHAAMIPVTMVGTGPHSVIDVEL